MKPESSPKESTLKIKLVNLSLSILINVTVNIWATSIQHTEKHLDIRENKTTKKDNTIDKGASIRFITYPLFDSCQSLLYYL